MNPYLATASALLFLLGATHTVLGERLIFRRLGGIPLDTRSTVLPTRSVRILRATWHLATVLGWGFGAVLLRLSLASSRYSLEGFVEGAMLVAMLSGSLIVLVGTRGKHPGWFVLLVICALLWIG